MWNLKKKELLFDTYCILFRQMFFLKGSSLFVAMFMITVKVMPEISISDFSVMINDFQKRYLELISGKKVEDFLGK